MFVWVARWLVHALALTIVATVVPGIHLENFTSALFAVVVMSVINTLIKPILFVLTLPITIVTLGLFALILNALMFMLASSFLSGFSVDGFTAALLGSIVLSLVTMLLNGLIR